jgi:hypothetical protein
MRKYSLEFSIALIFVSLVVALLWSTLAGIAPYLPFVLVGLCIAGLVVFMIPGASASASGEDLVREKYAPKYFGQALLSSLVGVALIIGAAAVLNRDRFTKTFDVTQRKTNSLSPETEKFLAAMEQDVGIYCVPNADPRERYCEENAYLRGLYAERSPRIQHAAVDLADMQIMARVQPAGYGRLVFLSEDNRSEVVGEITESKMTNALINLVKSKKTVYFLAGNGEPSTGFEGKKNYANMVEILKSRAYEVKEVSLADGPLPADAKLLVAGSAEVSYNQIVENELRKFLAGGGRLLLTLNPYRSAGMNKLFADLGVELGSTLLINNRGATSFGAQLAQISRLRPPVVIGEFSQSSPITSVLTQRDVALADGARPFVTKDTTEGEMTIKHTSLASAFHAAPVTLTDEQRNALQLTGALNVEPDPGFDPKQNWPVATQIEIENPALLAEGLPQSSVALASSDGAAPELGKVDPDTGAPLSEDAAAQVEAEGNKADDASKKTAEVVLLGFELAGQYERAAPANAQLLPLAVAHLYRDEDLISIPTKDFAPRQFKLDRNPGAYLFLFSGLLPVAMALAGFYIWMRRRAA